MTAIVALSNAQGFTFGADSAATCDDGVMSQDVTDDGKLFEVGPMCFGYCGSGRLGQLLQFKLAIPKKKRTQTGLEYMSTSFIDAVRDCLKTGGFSGVTKYDEKEGEERGGDFIVGFEKQLYVVEEDYQVLMPRLPFTSIGCGAPIALGAMYALHESGPVLTSRQIAQLALRAAERYSAGVRRPFQIKQRPFA